MANLTSRQESFIKRMARGPEYAWKGYELLLTRKRPEAYFDDLAAEGLFDAAHNPAPVQVPSGGFQVPYWKALDYLTAVSRIAGERTDLVLAEKVMQIVRAVTESCRPANEERGNYHTYREFARIIGLLPTTAVRLGDIDMIPTWLDARFDNSGVTEAIGEETLPRFLRSEVGEDAEKAARILRHVTELRWIDEKGWEQLHKKPISIADDFWLKDLLTRSSDNLGRRIGGTASGILADRLREAFSPSERAESTEIWRPAIEDHEQNHSFYELENLLVEGLRDVVTAWLETDTVPAGEYVRTMLSDGSEIVRRVGIHLLNENWSKLANHYSVALGANLLAEGHLHESYRLLKAHFGELDGDMKTQTLEAIRKIDIPNIEDAERIRRSLQRRWLSAVQGVGFEPADRWFAELNGDTELGGLPEHPDLHSYMTLRTGFGPSPYPSIELINLAELNPDGLINVLNDFKQESVFQCPTIKGLVQSLEEAVGLEPAKFIRILPSFYRAKRPYQYAVISEFAALWKAPKDTQEQLDWDDAWPKLFEFFEGLIASNEFWTEEVVESGNLTPTRHWIPPLIADFLSDASASDEHAYPLTLLPRALPIVQTLLNHAEMMEEQGNDPMFRTINSVRGKAIRALVFHALRECRLMQQDTGDHRQAWERVRPVFDAELAQCQNRNFEFSTLMGEYIRHLEFLDAEWLRLHIKEIFSTEFQLNCVCAFHGLAYARESRTTYDRLVENGIMDVGLRLDLKGAYARERLVQRLAVAYLWNQEELDSPRFSYLLEQRRIEDLVVIAEFLAEIQQEDDGVPERALAFWAHCLAWAQTLPAPPAKLLSALSRLTWYIREVGSEELSWLLAVAPYVSLDRNASRFIEYLDPLADRYPREVSGVLQHVFAADLPHYDYENRIESLLEKLGTLGLRTEVMLLIERLRPSLPNIAQLYNRLNQ